MQRSNFFVTIHGFNGSRNKENKPVTCFLKFSGQFIDGYIPVYNIMANLDDLVDCLGWPLVYKKFNSEDENIPKTKKYIIAGQIIYYNGRAYDVNLISRIPPKEKGEVINLGNGYVFVLNGKTKSEITYEACIELMNISNDRIDRNWFHPVSHMFFSGVVYSILNQMVKYEIFDKKVFYIHRNGSMFNTLLWGKYNKVLDRILNNDIEGIKKELNIIKHNKNG